MSHTGNTNHYLFHLGHPAHYHVFKNTIAKLKADGNKVSILIKKKDVLETLLMNEGHAYVNILPEGRTDSKLGILTGMLKTDYRLLLYCLKHKPALLIGTSYAISHVGRLLSIPSINVNEDDADVVPFYARFSYLWASVILSPVVCKNGKWENKSVKYQGYHELAYLHPVVFTPDATIANKYLNLSDKFYLLRFANLTAHHDAGISGITDKRAEELVTLLSKTGKVYITSERALPKSLESYRLKIDPVDIHHVMAFASLYIGDSQTMACEAGVLGVPFIRFNDFVGRIGYLDEMENKYQLGFGFRTSQYEEMKKKIWELLAFEKIKGSWLKKRDDMLAEKINLSSFLTWFIENYPESLRIMKENPDYQNRFK